MSDVAVVSAMFGGVDQVRCQTPQDIDVDWLLFTDDADLEVPEPWRVALEPERGAHPNLAAKRFKASPPVPHRYVVWIDANMEVTSSSFAREALACIHDGIALHRHPRRDCIYDEAEACLTYEAQGGKYDNQPVREQVAHYRDEGYPDHAGLYACGTLAWDRGELSSHRLGMDWLAECATWSYQDQLSFPVVCRRLGISPGVFWMPQLERYRPLGNRWLVIHPHR